MTDDRWIVNTQRLCNGFASYYGPCGDTACADCYPGTRYCNKCRLEEGECECDNCKICGKDWKRYFGKHYSECPFCHCQHCGRTEVEHQCSEGFDIGKIERDDEIEKRRREERRNSGDAEKGSS